LGDLVAVASRRLVRSDPAAELDSDGDRGNTHAVPSSPPQRRSDIKLLIGAGVGVLLGGVVIAAAILALTARGTGPNVKVPLPFGLESSIHDDVRQGGPINIAGLSGDDGFWVAIENHRLVALLVKQPKPQSCTLRWRGSKDTFTCDDQPVGSRNMARFRSYTAHHGPNKGAFMVALREVEPAPDGPPGTGG
jgi:hypothetical protein